MAQTDKPKPPPPPTLTRLGAASLVETIDGPMEIVKLAGKVMPVLTRFESGDLGFRMMINIREIEADAPLLRFRNADGQVVTVGEDHVFVRADLTEVRAADLKVGEELETGWSYPPGYQVPEADEYGETVRGKPWENVVKITGREDAGRGPVFGVTVKETKAYYLTFGARSRAQV